MPKSDLNVQTSEESLGDAVDQEVDQEMEAPGEESGFAAFMWLLVFSVMMFTFPFATFYGVRSWLDVAYEFTAFQTNCFSVLASVLVVNMIICLYVFKAFREGHRSVSPKKDN